MLWRGHHDMTSWDNCRPELLATDGREVRRLVSLSNHIAFQAFDHEASGREIVTKVERSVAQGVALVGYSMLSGNEAIAILHTAPGLQPGWVAYPHRKSSASTTVTTLPLAVANIPKLRLIGGAKAEWHKGETVLEAALEQRGQSFLASQFAFNIIEHVQSWELRATQGRGDTAKSLKVLKRKVEPEISRSGEFRLQGVFTLDEMIWKEFADREDFHLYFVVEFDQELACLPADWSRFWFRVEDY